jgi:hypothetical protein
LRWACITSICFATLVLVCLGCRNWATISSKRFELCEAGSCSRRTASARLSAQVYAFVRRSNDSADDEGEDELVALLSLHRNVQCVHADANRRAALAVCTVLRRL